jgi:ABC-2 type transport system ATP-binding protein
VSDNCIELVDLTKKYGDFTAVDNLNLTIRKGVIFGLVGPNGAGKSTTILMMLGLTEPTSGTVRVGGIDSTTQPLDVKRKVGYLPEDVGFYDDLTGLENLLYTASLNSIAPKEAEIRAEGLLKRIGLTDAANKKTGKYSRGMRQRLGLADVLIKEPGIIILDEPTLGIDPNGVKEFLDLIAGLSREKGITVLFSSHHLHHVQQVCDRVGLFIQGKLIAAGNIQSLSRQLFSGSPYIIEAAVGNDSFTEKKLRQLLAKVDGVDQIRLANGFFEIESQYDNTAEIARSVVQAGEDLKHLCKREYGLDEIYYRYFEGGVNHE